MRAAAALLGIALAMLACDSGQSDARLNLVVIVIDTLRADHVGAYGYARDTTPHLDALAARSLLVESAYAQSSWTKPSIASLLSSLHAHSHGVRDEWLRDRLPARVDTLAELLSLSGWQTAAVSQNPHIHPRTGFGQGFDHFESRDPSGSDPRAVSDGALRWLEDRDRHAPFFLYLHWIDPHGPYEPAPEERAIFLEGRTSERVNVRQGLVAKLLRGAKAVALDAEDLGYLEALYDAELRAVDHSVGELLAALETLNVSESTVVLVTSDHGEEFLEHGSLKHGYWLYEESLRVPMILHVPGAEPRRAGGGWVRHVDVAPTLLELLGVAAPAEFEGQSFAGLLAGAPGTALPVLAETRWRNADRRTVRSGRHKLIVDLHSGRAELYDLVADPGERHDRAASEPERAETLMALLEATRSPRQGAPPPRPGTDDPELEASLRALGYLEE